jgi:hypothetical protein
VYSKARYADLLWRAVVARAIGVPSGGSRGWEFYRQSDSQTITEDRRGEDRARSDDLQ